MSFTRTGYCCCSICAQLKACEASQAAQAQQLAENARLRRRLEDAERRGKR